MKKLLCILIAALLLICMGAFLFFKSRNDDAHDINAHEEIEDLVGEWDTQDNLLVLHEPEPDITPIPTVQPTPYESDNSSAAPAQQQSPQDNTQPQNPQITPVPAPAPPSDQTVDSDEAEWDLA